MLHICCLLFSATRGPKYFSTFLWFVRNLNSPTYFSVQTVSHEIFVESFHVAGETPESVHLWVKNLQEAAAQVIHALSITHLWITNGMFFRYKTLKNRSVGSGPIHLIWACFCSSPGLKAANVMRMFLSTNKLPEPSPLQTHMFLARHQRSEIPEFSSKRMKNSSPRPQTRILTLTITHW